MTYSVRPTVHFDKRLILKLEISSMERGTVVRYSEETRSSFENFAGQRGYKFYHIFRVTWRDRSRDYNTSRWVVSYRWSIDSWHQPCILHGFRDTKPQIFRGRYVITVLWCAEPAPARITELPHSVNVLNNSALSLICRASGIPEPRILWSHNGRPIRYHERRYTIVHIAAGSVLRIGRVRAPQDNGSVMCMAGNGVSVYASAQTSIGVYTADNGLCSLYNDYTNN